MSADQPKARDRRQFIRDVTLGTAAVGAAMVLPACGGGGDERQIEFRHGVASGDPQGDRVILWTRATPTDAASQGSLRLRYEVASDAAFASIVRSGDITTGPERDYTAKVDVTGLSPATTYHYRFRFGSDTVSPVGRTRTLPAGAVTQVRMAVFSCSNYPAGYFNAYAAAAMMNDIDVAVHLGDYIYEYARGEYPTADKEVASRQSEPAGEILALADYRTRHAQYKTDPDLQALHAALPMIAVWDDHEIANDTYRTGAENHTEGGEGSFAARRAAALRAYHEWMPTRLTDPAAPDRIYRSFQFGNLVSLHMLDTRLIGRDRQLTLQEYAAGAAADPNRQLLGADQTAWLNAQLSASTATWQVLGQQVLMGRMEIPLSVAQAPTAANVTAFLTAKATPAELRTAEQQALVAQPRIPYNLDAWDGYPVARETVLGAVQALDRNLVVLAGDTHNAWASDLTDLQGRRVGVEFATPSVTSPGFEAYLADIPPAQLSAAFPELVDPLVYCDTSRRGFMVVTATAEQVRCDWYYVAGITTRQATASLGQSLRVLPGAANRVLIPA